MSTDAIPIACSIDRNYALPLAVMLASLALSLRRSARAVLYLVYRSLPDEILRALGTLVDLHPITCSPGHAARLPRDPRFPPEAAIPLLLPDLLPPRLDRVLFLDADLLVLDDVAKLWETPLDGATLAAAPDAAIPLCSGPRGVKNCAAHGISAAAPYFNAGVMLLDLRLWKQRNVTARALRYLTETGRRVDFLHQEALNAILPNHWRPLDARWNLLASKARFAPHPHPGIVHFSGRFKPWKHSIGGPFAARYNSLLRNVACPIPRPAPILHDRIFGAYDRFLRRYLYPLEHQLWKQRII